MTQAEEALKAIADAPDAQFRDAATRFAKGLAPEPAAFDIDGADWKSERAVTDFIFLVLMGRRPHKAYDLPGGEALANSMLHLDGGAPTVLYHRGRHVFAQDDMVLTVVDGTCEGADVTFFDLWRVEGDRIVGHKGCMTERSHP